MQPYFSTMLHTDKWKAHMKSVSIFGLGRCQVYHTVLYLLIISLLNMNTGSLTPVYNIIHILIVQV